MSLINYIKKLPAITLALVLLLTVVLPNQATAQTIPTTDLTGYGWSETTGWISFNCKTGGPTGGDVCASSNYKVAINADRTIRGWAWSEHIGWIKFGGLSGFPTGSGTVADNAVVTGTYPNLTFTGWARACAGTVGGNCSSMATNPSAGGWDGWISLGGTSYSVRTNSVGMVANSYAWGSMVVGWIDMSTYLGLDITTATLTATNCTIPLGSGTCNSRLTWNFTNAKSPNIYNSTTGVTYSTVVSGTNASHPIRFGTNQIQARDGSLTLTSRPVTATCAAGARYNSGTNICELTPAPPPVIDITIRPADFIRYGSKATIDLEITGLADGSCSLTGYGMSEPGLTASTNFESPELRSKTTFTLTCIGSYGNVSDTATVEIIPSAQEI